MPTTPAADAAPPPFLPEGQPWPMGASVRDGGVNLAVFSAHAERMDLCLFDDEGATEIARWRLQGPHDNVFTGFLAGAGAGLVYGLRAHGPHRPEAGLLFNPAKLLLDPCARQVVGRFRWDPAQHGYVLGHADGLRALDATDNAAIALKGRVAPPDAPAAAAANRPRIADADVVLYEVHAKGFSMQHPGIPEALRGSYAALAHPAAIAHFRALGVTTLSLLPVQYAVDEGHLAERGLTNYWGYNTLGFFCPDPRLSRTPGDPDATAAEFRAMVAALHAAGLEVVLDVVYNHTPEGSEHGPTLSFRGLDNASWYRLDPKDRSHCENLTGCGNTLNVAHPRVTQFVLDSLRYWVECMGVDGFRFDLAPVLGRTHHGFDPHAPFFAALRQDPVLARARLIAEPWDAGPHGYQVGRFPGRFLEWNDRFRDAVRGYWLAAGTDRGEFARRFTGSDDLFHHDQRRPTAGVNFIAVHDGFTLADVVSYERKHNHANGEDNRDGRDEELSANFGVEGPAADPAIAALRLRVRRAMLASLLLAQGTPMLCAGDEIGNSQRGNNNAYCQDNPTGWLDWPTAEHDTFAFVARLLALRRAEPLLRHDRWFVAEARAGGPASAAWHAPDGDALGLHDWHARDAHALACLLDPGDPAHADAAGGDARLLLLFNPERAPREFALPPGDWQLALDSSAALSPGLAQARGSLDVPAHALVVLRQHLPSHASPQD
jgi:isoamylase